MKKFYRYQSYNTAKSKYICGLWNLNINVIKELHINKHNSFFLAVYGEDGDMILPITVEEAIEFIQSNKPYLKWYPGGAELFQENVNKIINNFTV